MIDFTVVADRRDIYYISDKHERRFFNHLVGPHYKDPKSWLFETHKSKH